MLVPNDKRTNGVRQLSTRAYGWRIANYAAIGSGTGPALVPPSVAIQDNRERRRAPKPGAPLRTGKRTGSSTTAINAVRPSSPAKYRSTTGTRSSPIPPSPTPSSIASSTTLTVSHSRETACARSLPSAPSLTPPENLNSTPHAGNDTPATFVGTGGRLDRNAGTYGAYTLEIEPRYVDVAIKRWQAFSRKDAIHADSRFGL